MDGTLYQLTEAVIRLNDTLQQAQQQMAALEQERDALRERLAELDAEMDG